MKRKMKKINIIIAILLIAVLFGQILFSCANNSNNKTETVEKTDNKKDCLNTSLVSVIFESEDLIIHKISDHVYEHITFLKGDDLERIPCNGMIVVNNNEAIVFDTPTNDQNSKELIEYLTTELHWKILAIVATNLHPDYPGGLRAFHRNNITSYASNQTISLAKKENFIEPQNGFDKTYTLSVGDKKVHLEYFGEGYTKDNIVVYFPHEQVLFGGGLIKGQRNSVGNLKHSNTDAWPETIRKIKLQYPDIKKVLPKYGELGGSELLDYTIDLFK